MELSTKLKEAGSTVSILTNNISRGEFGINEVPNLIKLVIEKGYWKERFVESISQVVYNNSFKEFVTKHIPNGLGTSIDTIKRLCYDNPEVLALIAKSLEVGQGKRTDLFGGDNEPPDNVSKLSYGNSKSQTLKTLKREKPEFYEKVIAGEMSANKAAIESGLRMEAFTVKKDTQKAAETICKKFTKEEVEELILYLESIKQIIRV